MESPSEMFVVIVNSSLTMGASSQLVSVDGLKLPVVQVNCSSVHSYGEGECISVQCCVSLNHKLTCVLQHLYVKHCCM